ncbi:DUF1176 domain-containing protein [Acidovorax sp. sic0104]|uniref:DUF1176 domain-containing protein n=1 Tax=Acidovorax sp. sic0104 TaxID=2854784 RepID=UPI001C45B0EF|nr:DUF1176 domain-containing protein [Acidovorax sp. sic0104]MBV7539584.1 DUF1176 domain-containing protein [Acidovorax sp. sic0104]
MRIRFAAGPAGAMLACALALAACQPSVHAAEPKSDPVGFQHKDWALQCDNTRTCRAVGYQSEDGDSEPVSILLTRPAGPNTPVQVDLQVYTEKTELQALELRVGKVSVRDLEGHDIARVPARQVPHLLQELLKNDQATVLAGKERWTLSLAGASAVLLKMDEAQGRVGTPGALVRRGSKAESSVLQPVAAPSVKAVLPAAPRKGDGALAKPLIAEIDRANVADQCTGQDPLNPSTAEVRRLTDRKLLLSLPCGMGAYNSSSLLWIANDRPPHKPEPLQDVDGEFDADTGAVHSAMKGRGIGDCWSTRDWQFDGRGFVLTREAGDSMCRGFPGGAWQLPSYVTR